MARDKTRTKRKERKNIATGVAHVNSSFNNTKIFLESGEELRNLIVFTFFLPKKIVVKTILQHFLYNFGYEK